MSILALTSDTLAVTPAAGNIEYSSPVIVATPIGTQRGIVPTQQYYRLNTAYVGTQLTTAQNFFGVSATLSASTVYEFEVLAAISKSAGTTSHTVAINFGGTATVNNINFTVDAQFSNSAFVAPVTRGELFVQNTTPTNPITASASAAQFFIYLIKGTVSINAGGTFTPQYTLSADPGGAYSTSIGCYIRINPLSASGANTSVGTWA